MQIQNIWHCVGVFWVLLWQKPTVLGVRNFQRMRGEGEQKYLKNEVKVVPAGTGTRVATTDFRTCNQTCRCRGAALDLHSKGSPFASWRDYRMAYLRFLVGFFPSLYRRISGSLKVKVKLSLCFLTEHNALKAYWGSGGTAPRILDLGTR